MEHESPRHEKIRFRRDEITDLGTFPSAANLDPKPARSWLPRRARKILLGLLGGLASLVVLAALAIYAIGASGIGSERLRLEAEKALEEFAGIDIDASVGPARITFDGLRFLALEVRDVSLKGAEDGLAIADARLVRFGIRFLPLLSGEVRLSSARLSNARISAAAMPAGEGSDPLAAFRNEEGLLDPDQVAKTVFAGVHKALDAMGSKSLRGIALEDVEFALPPGGRIARIRVVNSVLSEAAADSVVFSAETEVDGRAVTVEANATRDAVSKRITALDVAAEAPASRSIGTRAINNVSRIGALDLKITGAEGLGPERSHLKATLLLKDSAFDLGTRGVVSGDIDFAGTLIEGSNRVSVERLRASVGRSALDFQGVIGPRPPTGIGGDAPAYRFDLVSPRSTISPAGSPEPALNTYLRLTGTYLTNERRLAADEIILKSGRGEVLGTASMRLVEGKAPGVSVAFSVHDMSVSHVKQLWPWFSARGARGWVLQNLFGGRVTDARLQFHVEPGRLGNGVPLSAPESFGTFAIEGTRFDTAGLIPPVRDATGVVDYRGNDVDISLSAGTVFLPSGRTVAASAGTLTVKKANVPPVIGALDINVAGDAPAVAELASYDPINAMRHVGLAPQDFTGEVSGNVKADIPLQKGIDSSKLGWLVALDYKNLSIAKPFDGQVVTEAEGTIVIDRSKAVIAAKAKLGEAAAEIDAVEPLGKGEDRPDRKRIVKLTLDDKAREKLVPGISDLVKGPINVTLDAKADGKKMVEADLTGAQLSIPWAGWTKGAGIKADVSFVLENSDGKSTLQDFHLDGETFDIKGSVALADGAMSQAKFSSVKLNRNDDVAVAVKKSGNNYAIDVSGNALDARSLVRQFTADTSTATKATSGGSVSVSANVEALTGFHGERLSNVKLDYSGSGKRVNGLDVTATASSGGAIEIRNTAEGGGRTMRMQSTDAGAILRFLDIYQHMEGGNIALSLKGGADGPMAGQVDARDFFLVNEPRLSSIVSTTPPGGERSLNQAVKRDIDTSRVKFERGFTQIDKGDGYLNLSRGVLRGPVIGATFQGTLYDKKGNMDMTGTFMPAYGLNRIFGEIPLIGILLGNGRDGGLIGVTFKLEGDADSPEVRINPLSVIAPGIFRSIFEFQ